MVENGRPGAEAARCVSQSAMTGLQDGGPSRQRVSTGHGGGGQSCFSLLARCESVPLVSKCEDRRIRECFRVCVLVVMLEKDASMGLRQTV